MAEEDYEVGYGKPPKGSQFKKGVSGNRKGRAKKVPNWVTIGNDECYRTMSIGENGKKVTTTMYGLALKQLGVQVRLGKPWAIAAYLKHVKELAQHTDTKNSPGPTREAADSILASFLEGFQEPQAMKNKPPKETPEKNEKGWPINVIPD